MDEIKRLTLSRKSGQRVVLTLGTVEVTVLVVTAANGVAKLCFDAPAIVKIRRSELPISVDTDTDTR